MPVYTPASLSLSLSLSLSPHTLIDRYEQTDTERYKEISIYDMSPRRVMANVLNCDIVGSELELRSFC